MPGKITAEHLCKIIIIYVRQSSFHQVKEHTESRQLQYDLEQRARKLGWPAHQIIVIDDDLGITATGTKAREGFEHLLSELCLGNVGALMFLDASRLTRNGREWQQILEFCGIVNCLIIDSDGIYDPRLPSDRLWLGMKASFTEYEVRQLQARARAAILNKASRGELFSILPAGLIRNETDQVELDPDRRIQQAIRGIFAKFEEVVSINQLYNWYQSHGIEVPIRDVSHGCQITWRVPGYGTLRKVLTNPLYAGAYQYPRTKTITRIVDGKLNKTAGHPVGADDKVFFHRDLFVGYISWQQYQHNQTIISNNATMKGATVLGASREGNSVLAGLLYCGQCSHKLSLRYYAGKSSPYYFCRGSRSSVATKGCLSFSGANLEAALSREIVAAVQPIAIEAAVEAEHQLNRQLEQQSDVLYHALEQARYEAARIERQFNAADPENYLVTRELTSRWQKALEKVDDLQRRYDRARAQQRPLAENERTRLFDLANDLEQVWHHPDCDAKTKTRLARLLIKQIWINPDGETKLKATIHWHGGVHTTIQLKRNKRGRAQRQHNDKEPDVVALIRRLAQVCDDQQITRILNRLKYHNQNGQSWIEAEIHHYRQANNIPAFSPQKYQQRGLINLSQAAQILELSCASVLKLIKWGLITANQVIEYAPWEIEQTELQKPNVRQAVAAMQNKIPFNENQLDLTM